jgi:hypothetical protein
MEEFYEERYFGRYDVRGGVCLSAQTTPANKKNYAFVDFAPLLAGVLLGGFGIGGGYERALTNYFSVVGYFDYLAVEELLTCCSGPVSILRELPCADSTLDE